MTVSRNGENAAIEVLNLPWCIVFFLPATEGCLYHPLGAFVIFVYEEVFPLLKEAGFFPLLPKQKMFMLLLNVHKKYIFLSTKR